MEQTLNPINIALS